jgi:DNA-binding MarR family transcriptional regulator
MKTDSRDLSSIPAICVAFNIGKAYRSILKVYETALKECSLTTMQYGLLVHIGMLEPASSSDISAATGHDLSTLTRTIAPLVAQGYVVSLGVDSQDKRVKRYGLTKEGRTVLMAGVAQWEKAQQTIIEELGELTWKQTLPLLKAIQEINPNTSGA